MLSFPPIDVVPFFSGLRRKQIVVPVSLFKNLTDEELGMVLEHERVHSRQRDHLIALLQQLALMIHWWEPPGVCAVRMPIPEP